MTAVLNFTILRDGYGSQPSYPTVETQLSGPLLTKRADNLWLPHRATANWQLSRDQYTQFMGFFNTQIKFSTQTFITDLVSDIGHLFPHKCRLVGQKPVLQQTNGTSFSVSAELEVYPNPTYSGLIKYREPGDVVFAAFGPTLVGPIQPGDTIRIFNSSGIHPSSTPLNMDGVYEVDTVSGFNTLQLLSPAVVNTSWTTLATLGAPGEYGDAANGNVFSTLVRIPTP